MPTPKSIGRRAFLTGLGGATIALPWLEAMLPRKAWAAGNGPKRFVSMFAGIEQLQCVPTGNGGAGYTMPPGLASLEAVRQYVSVVSNLTVAPAGAGEPPAGGRANPHHGNIMKPVLTGWRSTNDNYGIPHTATADQIVAEMIGTDTHYRSLEYCAQPDGYRGGDAGIKTVLAYGQAGAARIAQRSPQQAWESMFMNFQPTNPADLAAKAKVLQRRLSVLDLVKSRGDHLVSQVSASDRIRLEQHFDTIRDLENQLADIPDTSGAGCEALGDPGADPTQTNYGNVEHGGSTGYTGEDERATFFVDLIHMAFVCDLTRVASLMINFEQSVMSLEPLWGVAYEMHDLTHNDVPNRNDIWNAVTSWQVGFFARLVDKLQQTAIPTGGTLLDDTVVVMTNSGGPSGHGGSNMAMPIAGCPSVLRMGEHIVPPDGSHPSQMWQTAMHAVGVDQDFGELPGLVDGLLV